MSADLSKAPKYLRATPGRGVAASAKPVDRKGGYRNAGLISGVSVITRGEALGHDMWIDDVTLEQTAEYINQFNRGVKSRFTHPSLSGDGLGKHVGRVMDATVEGDQVFADQHFIDAAHKTPDGDLATYLMDLAEEDATAYGLSIVFAHDMGAMDRFTIEHMNEDGIFESPDPDNVNNYPHARIAEIRAADAVDEPAANPGGLFARDEDIARQADELAAFALGLSDSRPAVTSLGLDPERVRGFATRFLTTHKLEVKAMVKDTKLEEQQTDPPADEPKQDEGQPVAEEKSDEQPAAEAPSEPAPEPAAASRQEFARFREAFGDKAADYFANGLTFSQSQERFTAHLREENEKLRQQLSGKAHATGESEPVDFNPTDENKKRGGFASKIRFAGESK